MLKDTELKVDYLAQELQILALINDNLAVYKDEHLAQFSNEFSAIIAIVSMPSATIVKLSSWVMVSMPYKTHFLHGH